MRNTIKVSVALFLLVLCISSVTWSQDTDIDELVRIAQQRGVDPETIKEYSRHGAESMPADSLNSFPQSDNPMVPSFQDSIKSDESTFQVTADDSLDISERKEHAEELPGDDQKRFMSTNERYGELEYYGYSVFDTDAGVVGPLSTGPTDPGYVLGAGDVVRLTLWGEVEFQYELAVDRDGTILIPRAGQVFVAGSEIEGLRDRLKNTLSRFYSGLASDPPTIFMDITLARLRESQIYIMGKVARPGAYSVSSYATAFNALYAVGGPTVQGSLREVRIIRGGKVLTRVDLYDYLLKGISTGDLRLMHNDIVFVPPRQNTIAIDGEILQPGIYELAEGESLADLVSMSGGLIPGAYAHRVQIDRITPVESRHRGENEHVLMDVDVSEVLSGRTVVELYDGDIVTVFPIIERMENYVEIEGYGIERPGKYELNGELKTLSDLITAADGLTDDAYTARADLFRVKDDLTEEMMTVDLRQVLSGNSIDDIPLQRLDRLYVYSRTEMTEKPTVRLMGFVKEEGEYPLYENMTLQDILFRYSGLQDSLTYARAFLERGDIRRYDENGSFRYIVPFSLRKVWSGGENISLRNGDEIILYENTVRNVHTGEVVLSGAVKEPGTYRWMRDMTLADLLREAGGFAEGAWFLNAEVARFPANGIPGETSAVIHTVSLVDTTEIMGDPEFLSGAVMAGVTPAAGFILQPNDNVFIRTNPDFNLPKTVTVEGEVNRPGEYVLERENEKLSRIITRAGGLKSTAYIGGGQLLRSDERVYVDFEKVVRGRSGEDIILHAGDHITIPTQPNAVMVSGEVINPGYYKFIERTKAKSYLQMAGGKTEAGDRVYIQEPSGRLREMTLLSNPRIKDGSIITVYPKPEAGEKSNVDWSETIKETFAIMSSALMIVYLAEQIDK